MLSWRDIMSWRDNILWHDIVPCNDMISRRDMTPCHDMVPCQGIVLCYAMICKCSARVCFGIRVHKCSTRVSFGIVLESCLDRFGVSLGGAHLRTSNALKLARTRFTLLHIHSAAGIVHTRAISPYTFENIFHYMFVYYAMILLFICVFMRFISIYMCFRSIATRFRFMCYVCSMYVCIWFDIF